MANTLLIDYAWQHPNPAAIKKAGYSGVLRYFSNDPTKDLTAAEVKALHAAGLSVGIVWETTTTRAEAGYQAGISDRKRAEARAQALGYPKNCPIFYAVDEDADPAKIYPYFLGVTAPGHAYPAGAYGSARVQEYLHLHKIVTFAWQTEAWSGTKVNGWVNLYQRVRHTLAPIPGVATNTYDENVLINSLPLWTPTVPKPPAPKPAPKPTPPPNPTPQPGPVVLPPPPPGALDWLLKLIAALRVYFGK